MTVAELIELLKGMPQDADVAIYGGSEDYGDITPEHIELHCNYDLWDERLRRDRTRQLCVTL